MTTDQTVLLAVGGLAVVCVALLVSLLASWKRLRAAYARTSEELATLRQRVDDLAGTTAAPRVPAAALPAPATVEFLITDLGREEPVPAPVRLDGTAFADILLKETVVKAASLAHGVRRGLAPATRNRIRFEMKQEVRRSRKQRRSDLKTAQRDLHARQRASLRVDAGEAS